MNINHVLENDDKVRHKPKKKHPCKKLKGLHDFEIVKTNKAKWATIKGDGTKTLEIVEFTHLECSACGKKEVTMETIKKPI